jgi:Spy/CpxP family protein refolding chaperone
MKKLILLLSIFIFSGMAEAAIAPPDSARKARIEALKKKRRDLYTQKLDLTPAQADKFFPIWDDYELQLREAKKTFKRKWEGKDTENGLTEEESAQYLRDAMKLRETEMNLMKVATEKLIPAITAKKTLKVKKVQREVQRELVAEVRKNRGGKQRLFDY